MSFDNYNEYGLLLLCMCVHPTQGNTPGGVCTIVQWPPTERFPPPFWLGAWKKKLPAAESSWGSQSQGSPDLFPHPENGAQTMNESVQGTRGAQPELSHLRAAGLLASRTVINLLPMSSCVVKQSPEVSPKKLSRSFDALQDRIFSTAWPGDGDD